jgi:hypothetical protein
MQVVTINSREHGEQVFRAPSAGGYVSLNDKQVCEGGGFRGATLTCGADDLPTAARRWWKQYLASQR